MKKPQRRGVFIVVRPATTPPNELNIRWKWQREDCDCSVHVHHFSLRPTANPKSEKFIFEFVISYSEWFIVIICTAIRIRVHAVGHLRVMLHTSSRRCVSVCACNSASQLKSFWSAVNRVAFVSFSLWNRSPQTIAKSTLNTIWIIILWLFFHFSCSSFWLYAATTTGEKKHRDFLPETWRHRCVTIQWLSVHF